MEKRQSEEFSILQKNDAFRTETEVISSENPANGGLLLSWAKTLRSLEIDEPNEMFSKYAFS